MLKAVGFIGYKRGGKTTAIMSVAKVLKARGYKVAIIKHIPEHDIDKRDTDTYKFRQVAPLVAAITHDYTAIYYRDTKINRVIAMIGHEVDFLLIEGFKHAMFCPHIICARTLKEVNELRSGLEIAISGPISEDDNMKREAERRYNLKVINALKNAEELANIIEKKAFILPNLNCGLCGYDCSTMAKLIVSGAKSIKDCKATYSNSVTVFIDNNPLPLNEFVQKIIRNAVMGILSTLKGFKEGEIRIIIKV
ncbi:MAG: molybdopterin-guanine dinucleotide biosynthesis protein B [Thermoprotei archaeon]|nr:molybdopterin-guanine dinucleotide biosynthesis protein B [Thermoprotei archaeon]